MRRSECSWFGRPTGVRRAFLLQHHLWPTAGAAGYQVLSSTNDLRQRPSVLHKQTSFPPWTHHAGSVHPLSVQYNIWTNRILKFPYACVLNSNIDSSLKCQNAEDVRVSTWSDQISHCLHTFNGGGGSYISVIYQLYSPDLSVVFLILSKAKI